MLTALKSARLNGVPFRRGEEKRRTERERGERGKRGEETNDRLSEGSFGRLDNKYCSFAAVTFS
jgi:hypothetical protein